MGGGRGWRGGHQNGFRGGGGRGGGRGDSRGGDGVGDSGAGRGGGGRGDSGSGAVAGHLCLNGGEVVPLPCARAGIPNTMALGHCERWFEALVFRGVGDVTGNDLCLLYHPNGLCVVCLAPWHPAVAGPCAVRLVVFPESMLKQQVSGKRKHGATVLRPRTVLCRVEMEDDGADAMAVIDGGDLAGGDKVGGDGTDVAESTGADDNNASFTAAVVTNNISVKMSAIEDDGGGGAIEPSSSSASAHDPTAASPDATEARGWNGSVGGNDGGNGGGSGGNASGPPAFYDIAACVHGELMEPNGRLAAEAGLLASNPLGEGFVAIIRPNIDYCRAIERQLAAWKVAGARTNIPDPVVV
ncbi:unnamed protein product [Phaeothamnion confervicola]